jgi:putative DNA primase/helicase
VTLEALLDRLHGVRWAGGSCVSQCPVPEHGAGHGDKNPSLSVRVHDGKILLHCHAGCTVEAICAALGIETRDLFLEPKAGPRIVATYDYVDESGALLFQSVRYEPKDFRQRRPDGKGGWIWNLNGVRRVPYRLPEILAAQSVLIVEGEKDVETARQFGFVSTCNAGGAGKWRPEYSDVLKSKRLAVIADTDEPGRRHAQQVAESLALKAASLRVLELPAAKDLTEWYEHGGKRDELRDLILKTPEWKATSVSAAAKRKLEVYSCSQFLDTKFSDNGQPLIRDLVDAQGRVLIVGKPKTMKSLMAVTVAFEAACGFFPVLGKFPVRRPIRTVYAQFEDRRGEIQARLNKLKASHNDFCPVDENFKVFIGRALDLTRVDCRSELEGTLDDARPELLVMDVMRVIFPGDINKGNEVQPFLDYLDSLCERYKTAIILVHYAPKNSQGATAAGSTYLDGWPDLLIHVHKKRHIGNRTMAELEFRGRSNELEPIEIVYDETASPILTATSSAFGEQEIATAKKFLGAGWSIRDLAEVEDCSYWTARRLIETWLENGAVQVRGRGARGKRRFEFMENEAENDA